MGGRDGRRIRERSPFDPNHRRRRRPTTTTTTTKTTTTTATTTARTRTTTTKNNKNNSKRTQATCSIATEAYSRRGGESAGRRGRKRRSPGPRPRLLTCGRAAILFQLLRGTPAAARHLNQLHVHGSRPEQPIQESLLRPVLHAVWTT